jgi:hypothetical protein
MKKTSSMNKGNLISRLRNSKIGKLLSDELIDESYKNYCDAYEKDNSLGTLLLVSRVDGKSMYRKIDKDRFILLCTHDKAFSERWGLKIEKSDLSLWERTLIARSNHYEISENIKMNLGIDEDHTLHKILDESGIPSKLITLTYQNEKLEFYE